MKIPTALPTLEDVDRESALYKSHLAKGGKPIRIILEMVSGDETIDWNVIPDIPDDLPADIVWLIMFTGFMKDTVIKAMQPPTEKGTRK